MPVTAIGAFPVNTDNGSTGLLVSYLNSGIAWAVKAGGPQVTAATACGRTVAVQAGTTAAGEVAAVGPVGVSCQGRRPIRIDQVTSPDQAAAHVTSGKADAMAADSPVVDYQVAASHGALAASGAPYGVAPLGIMLPRNQAELAAAVRSALAAMVSDGSYGRLLAKWGLTKEAVTAPAVTQ